MTIRFVVTPSEYKVLKKALSEYERNTKRQTERAIAEDLLNIAKRQAGESDEN